ncbi:cation-translocating P-type ATPase [Picosynechococcus sp. PCC 7003]|uniref:cation-translocating P-type ATPase n=1 Tax=Picosynechococcus sp. PCC 7003 TaxID=374981 RepID=UPI000B2AACD7|nr:cation-translocating P-type ATPase [Picosynechococcus sp. PCC 7003]
MSDLHEKTSLPDPASPWHHQAIAHVLKAFQADEHQGLEMAEVERRQQLYGPNEIEASRGRNTWDIFLDQFKNVMLIMLIVVALISGLIDFTELQTSQFSQGTVPFKDTIAILAIVVLNGFLGFMQESRAEKALAALKKMSSPQVRVRRGGQIFEVKAAQLVPGDLMFIEAGSQLSADGLVLEAAQLQVRESALTGEANPVTKRICPDGLATDTPLGDRQNMVFSGTEVLQGRGKILITATGMTTELGKIAQMLQSVETSQTPLQKRMTHLGKILVTGSIILVILVVIFGSFQVGNFSRIKELIEVSLSMAVAVVPEGLPAVITVTLAIGTQRMVKRQALIRKLPAVETLGSVDTICSDKTGTLTQNKMVVQRLETQSQSLRITGEGYTPIGEFLHQDKSFDLTQDSELQQLLRACVLCNDAVLKQDGQDWLIIGDPTEGALLSLAGKGGLFTEALQAEWPRLEEFPFSSERKRMSVICAMPRSVQAKLGASYLLCCKGSPELVLERCQTYQTATDIFPLRAEDRAAILQRNNEMAQAGLRVLGFAQRWLTELPGAQAEANAEQKMTWLGLVGMMDAPRPEVKEAVARCRAAGIRPVMITGDHQLTAKAIAQQLGIAAPDAKALTGVELSKLSQADLEAMVETVSIYARVAPEHKLRIVQALQSRGKFVAMTGDGVNDAPALKQADIGIAMGITGTDVSKEASDMVLLDDNFATIVAATEEGRVVYTNIRHFIQYILGSNIGEVITIAAAPLIGLSEVPLIPLQILWMNLVTDGLPALALALEPAEADVMQRRPFNPQESIFARGLGSYIIRIGLIFSVISIALMAYSYNAYPDSWKTMVFTTLCLSQMGHAIAVRSRTQLTLTSNPLRNPYLIIAVAATTILQLMLIYVEPLRLFFDTQRLSGQQLLLCLGVSTLLFVWVELEKLVIQWYWVWKNPPKSR